MSRKLSRRKFIRRSSSLALSSALISKFGFNYALAANNDPVTLLLGSHMDYLQALAPAYAEKYGVTPSIETVTTPDLSVKLNSAYIARKSVGDAIFVTASEIAGLADKGWLMDMSDFVNDTLRPNGVMENSLTAATYKGKVYAAPITIGCPVLHWNKNLLKNAVDAFMGGKGCIKIDVKDIDNEALIIISDTGRGINRKYWKNIFNPGYSTKTRGWGLGLSLTLRIIKEIHGGKIYLHSSMPGKTIFHIILKNK